MLVDDEGHEDFQYNTKYNQYRIRYKDADAAEAIKNDLNDLLCADSRHKHTNQTPASLTFSQANAAPPQAHQAPVYEAPKYQAPAYTAPYVETAWISCGKMYVGEC